MKVLLGASDVCGLIHDLGEEYKRQGHRVTTISSGINKFYSYRYDLDPGNLIESFVKLKWSSDKLARLVSLLIKLMGRKATNFFNSIIIRKLLSSTDYYIQVYNSILWEEERQLKFLKIKNKKIITLFVGSDIR